MTTYTTDIQPNGILAFRGPDSIKFLQGQTTCHLDELTDTNAIYGAFCNPKGRIKTTFLLLKESDEDLLMLVDKQQIDYVRDELKMYIAFFKSEITDLTDDYRLIGALNGNEDNHSGVATFSLTRSDDRITISIPGSSNRSLILLSNTVADELQLNITQTNQWYLEDIQAGLIWTSEAEREKFLPHDINLPGLGGVSYDKGCYTGQEIVARMHYRGNPKYTTAVLTTTNPEVVFESPLKAEISPDKVKSIGHPVGNAISDGENTIILASIVKDVLEQQEIKLSIQKERTILCSINKPNLG